MAGQKFSWQGASGRWYEFDVARQQSQWAHEGGVYLFVKPGDPPKMEAGGPVCLYAAATESFASSLTRNDAWPQAYALDAREVHVIAIDDEARRERVLRDLLHAHTPLLNRQTLRRVA